MWLTNARPPMRPALIAQSQTLRTGSASVAQDRPTQETGGGSQGAIDPKVYAQTPRRFFGPHDGAELVGPGRAGPAEG